MDSKATKELNDIIAELKSIIKELEDISSGIRGDFKNIGNDKCANCIDLVVENYKTVRKKLEAIDTKSHGGGGRRF